MSAFLKKLEPPTTGSSPFFLPRKLPKGSSPRAPSPGFDPPLLKAWEVPEERAMCIKGILQSFEIGKEAMELRQEQLVEDWALYQAIFTNLKFARAGELREEEEKKTTHTLPLLLLLLLILLLCFLEVKLGFDLT